MKRPRITSPCAADNYAQPKERIAEVMFTDGTSCLISIRELMGVRKIEVYEASAEIDVIGCDGPEEEAT